ncbi:aromatic ring-hydroxylating dioxygenase subunit alpha [Kineosporia sp. NBRC 101731]|uniref:aromatic ring-hydroxylating oxygenase subunit alpha n=1 Tax=Kineosporia sp. NBRC 101731 TaxID=3032199 RepID=UPI0024A5E757|nr:aromatic ring-hydroxylating dioxygenase subunit alpha [Kineosporia sp. NBRC 101731]GLY31633.1 aromatic-ring-hydroxylating dioxygenase subunit alpha [Kineosporia sp. NBRC 101731]
MAHLPPPTALVTENWDEQTFRVHREAYRSQALFDAERDRVWARNWLYLGHETEIPNPHDFTVRTLAGRPLIFVRDGEGEIHAFLNSCPHRGTVVCRENQGNAKHFACFYHAWTFRSDGAVSSIPGADAYHRDEAFRASMALRSVARLEMHEGYVFVAFTPDVPPLLEHLGDAADYLTMIEQQHAGGMRTLPGTQLYSVRGNWKLAVENAMDGYHFAPTHNTFVGYLRESGFAVTDDDQYAYTLQNGHLLLVLTGHGGRISMLWEPRFGEDERVRTAAHRAEMVQRLGAERAHHVADESHILYVWPNLLLFDIEGLSIRQLEPVSPGVTDVRAWQLVPREEDPDARALRMRTVVSFVGPGGLATPDDIEAYEAVQRGIEATAGGGEIDVSDMSRGMADEIKGVQGRSIDEGAMRGFWRHWVDAVEPGRWSVTGPRPQSFVTGRDVR